MHALRLTSRKLALGPAAAIALTGAVTFTGFAVTQTASAGGSGQQISFCSPEPVVSVSVDGPNQDGVATHATAGDPANPLVRNARGCYDGLPGQWWKGDVNIHWVYSATDRHPAGEVDTVCSVPTSAFDDYFNCDMLVLTPLPGPGISIDLSR